MTDYIVKHTHTARSGQKYQPGETATLDAAEGDRLVAAGWAEKKPTGRTPKATGGKTPDSAAPNPTTDPAKPTDPPAAEPTAQGDQNPTPVEM
jgi:hypothetical protein